MNEKEVLLEAAKLIEQPNAWHQNTGWKNVYGHRIFSHVNATSYCMMGAIEAVLERNKVPNMDYKFANIMANFSQIFDSNISTYNDCKISKQSEAVETLKKLAKEIQC